MCRLHRQDVLGEDHGLGKLHGAEGRVTDSFNALQYIAGYDDLIGAYGQNQAAATQHFVTNGYSEGRSETAFDPLQYIASFGDLISAFGANAGAAINHFLQAGYAEGRVRDDFDAAQYLANYSDLQAAFGSNQQAATFHYITKNFAHSFCRSIQIDHVVDQVDRGLEDASGHISHRIDDSVQHAGATADHFFKYRAHSVEAPLEKVAQPVDTATEETSGTLDEEQARAPTGVWTPVPALS